MQSKANRDLDNACCNSAIIRGATDWNEGLHDACRDGHIALAELMIERGATDFDSGLHFACYYGQVSAAELMIAHGATNWERCLNDICHFGNWEMMTYKTASMTNDWVRKQIAIAELLNKNYAEADINTCFIYACIYGQIELARHMISRGANKWEYAFSRSLCSGDNFVAFIIAQWGLHDAKAAPAIQIIRRYIKRWRSTRRIQRWWRSTYPLWRELSYAPLKGRHYLQSFDHFKKNVKKMQN